MLSKFEIDACCLLYTSQLVSNVVNLDFSFRMRILSPSNSSRLRFYGGVLDFGVQDIQIQRRKQHAMVRTSMQESTLPALASSKTDPEVSCQNVLLPVFELTHTSQCAYLHFCLRSKLLRGGDLKQFRQKERTCREYCILLGKLLSNSFLEGFTA